MKPTSPEHSSPKLRTASRDSAEAAANRTFQSPATLSLDEDRLAHAGATVGRERLAGAFSIRIDRIRPDPKQPRKHFAETSLLELSMSIGRFGILQPITVQYLPDEDIYQLITGERRLQASKQLGLEVIPCWIRTPKTDEVLFQQIVENWQREDLHPFDLADSLAYLRDGQGISQKQLAKVLGKMESEVSKILSLLKLRESIQQQYRRDNTGTLSRRHLENIAKLPVDLQEGFHDRATEQKLTAKETETLVQQTLDSHRGEVKRGAPISTRKRIVTPKGTVLLLLRRKEVTTEDMIELLDLAKEKIKQESE